MINNPSDRPALEHTQDDDCPACEASKALAKRITDACQDAQQSGLHVQDCMRVLYTSMAVAFAICLKSPNDPQEVARAVQALQNSQDYTLQEALNAEGIPIVIASDSIATQDPAEFDRMVREGQARSAAASSQQDDPFLNLMGLKDRRVNPALAPSDRRNQGRRYNDLPSARRKSASQRKFKES